MSVIELVRDIWMNNACVKFEERSLNPSKVIALTTKLRRGGRRRGGGRRGGCVADENIISPKTYVSREYDDMRVSPIPDEILSLNKVEKRLLCRIQTCMTMVILPGGQYAEQGLVLNLHVDIQNIVNQLHQVVFQLW